MWCMPRDGLREVGPARRSQLSQIYDRKLNVKKLNL